MQLFIRGAVKDINITLNRWLKQYKGIVIFNNDYKTDMIETVG